MKRVNLHPLIKGDGLSGCAVNGDNSVCRSWRILYATIVLDGHGGIGVTMPMSNCLDSARAAALVASGKTQGKTAWVDATCADCPGLR